MKWIFTKQFNFVDVVGITLISDLSLMLFDYLEKDITPEFSLVLVKLFAFLFVIGLSVIGEDFYRES